jgi:hypothetical protein
VIDGPDIWKRALAAGQKRALYYFEVVDYQVIITSFYPDEVGITGTQVVDGIIISNSGYGITGYGVGPGYGN